ncbi:YfhO family protein [uncultured Polaribacter sp.]|uniref:YfhO family protein n=1 Tax=uncultured Polaribacter sp. TaxID=174711 RepID=UPI0026059956|nr:YfhO family protein [uncultured Polaribacter sp.]
MKISKILPYVFALLIFVLASLIYFHPVLKGQKLNQSDITQFRGMVKDMNDFRAENNIEPYWTGASFSGMPSYAISAYYPNDFVRGLDKLLRFLPRPADYTFLYFLSFFVLMLALKVEYRLAILGALGFGFSTYLIIIFGAGHNAKAHAIAYMPLVLAGVLWIFRKKYVLGFLVTGLAMALEIYANHIQMTYYLGFCLLILGIVEGVNAIKEKTLPSFIKQTAVIIAAVLLGIGANAPRILAMQEYSEVSTRGKSELTINVDGSKKEATKGLDKAYITQYSYAKLETFNLLIPRFMGGGTVESLGENSNFYQFIEAKAGKKVAKEYSEQVLTYWGDQPIVEAPAYIGAVLFFLFFLGIFLVKGRLKQWLVAATIFSIVLSWGRNFEIVTNFFINYVPLYNKFRAVSSIQVIAELCVPILAVLGLKAFFSKELTQKEKLNGLKKAVICFAGLVVVGFMFAHVFGTFEGLRDAQQYKQIPGFLDAVMADRKAMLLKDSLRALFLVLVASVLLWLFIKEKAKQVLVILGILAVVLFDLISVNKRYVNADDFKASKKIEKPFIATEADKKILEDKGYYRVANFAIDVMNDGSTSYFHNSIGGYHAAKLGRYNELFEYQIANNNMPILNMLNTKYLIIPNEKGKLEAQKNIEANGNVWFVQNLIGVNNANEEMQMLDSLDTKSSAVILNSDFNKLGLKLPIERDSLASITLKEYQLNKLVYASNTNSAQFAVFSEIFYKNGWNAYINGELQPHFRVNYVLRGMKIPAGSNEIVFKFEPKVIENGKVFSLTSYALLIFVSVGWFFYDEKKKKKQA